MPSLSWHLLKQEGGKKILELSLILISLVYVHNVNNITAPEQTAYKYYF